MNELLREVFSFLPQPWRGLAAPFLAFVLAITVGMAVRRVFFARMRRVAARTVTQLDDVLLDSLHGPTLLWVIILAIHVATDVSPLPRDVIQRAELVLIVLWILAVTIALSKLAGRVVQIWGAQGDGPPRTGTLGQVLASLLVGILGGLTLLRTLGIDITPVLTALGVGGLAVALALQDTLSNLFAGFYISIAGQIRVGDAIQLESGQRGYVTDIGWRSTTIRERNNNLIVIPNNKLAQSTVTNFHLPERRIVLTIDVWAPYDADLNKVEQLLKETGQETDIPGLLKEPAAAVQITNFAERAIVFTLACQVAGFEDQMPVQHALRKRIIERFRAAGIRIPHIPS